MKLIFDAIGAAPGCGGPEVHAREFLCAWMRKYPEDDVIAIGTRWPTVSDDALSQVRWITWPTRSILWRILGQMVAVPVLARIHRKHALLSSLTVLSPLSPHRRSFVFAHDWRHLLRPDEFSPLKRVYRRLWRSSANRAALTFCISEKTLRETQQVARKSNVVLAESGHDHALRWVREPIAVASLTRSLPMDAVIVVTFGHRNNKRPELVIRALANIQSVDQPLLVVLGAEGRYRDNLRELARVINVSEKVLLPGFVVDQEYREILHRADCVVLASTDEGFGLPVAEALSLGHPVIVTSDSGLGAIFAASVSVVEAEPAALAKAIMEALTRPSSPMASVSVHSWGDTATVVRKAITKELALTMANG